jgi:aspartate aminotransferase-like enzyme
MYKKLFIPGPVTVTEDVLQKMATPMIGHRGKEASNLQRSISDKLRKLMYTKNEILLSTSSGSGVMEGSIRSCTQKKAAVFSCGDFGNRWFAMAEDNNVPADKFEVAWGNPNLPEQVDQVLATGKYDLITITHNETSTGIMNPVGQIAQVKKKYPEVIFCVDTVSSLGGVKIEVDKWGIDICLTSSQKCLGLPPGLSLCSISEKALEAARKVKFRGTYFDLLKLYDYIQKADYQYPSTPSLSHMFALDYQLDNIFEEGLENRFARHTEMADYVRAWAKDKFALFAQEEFASNTVTCVKNIREINVGDLNKALGERGFMISNGYGKLADKTFRIAHMNEATIMEIKELLSIIDEILGL